MMTKFFALLTRLGADKLANAAALGTKLNITHMAVGDGGGTLPTPDTAQTKLVNERRRAAINVLSVDPKNTHQIIAEQVIPENEGGWWIREIGLFDQDGVLIAVGNCAETYKPQLQEGSGRTQTLRMVLIVSHTEAVSLKIDPSVVLATREYVDSLVTSTITVHEKSRNHPNATLKEKGFVVLSNAVDSNSETQASTPKAVKAAYDLAGKASQAADNCLEKAKNGADIQNKNEFVKNLGLSGTVEQAQNALDKRRNGADIPNKNEFVKNLGLIPIASGGTGAKTIRDAQDNLGIFGQSQRWQNVQNSRQIGVTYTNATNKPIYVSIIFLNQNLISREVFVDGHRIIWINATSNEDQPGCVTFIVPPNSTYRVGADGGILNWLELR
ncbi:phage tail protein [Xenorhabdus sp. ZM]|nr:phage tail protein [Xenorhabdus sp. ZM]